MAATCGYSSEEPLDYQFSVYGGIEDTDIEREDLQAWGKYSKRELTLRMFPGDHFFLHQQTIELQAAIVKDLLSYFWH